MKFKPTYDHNDSRAIQLVDRDGVSLEVMYVDDKNPAPVMISVNRHDDAADIFGLTRAKAIKLARAILVELDPTY